MLIEVKAESECDRRKAPRYHATNEFRPMTHFTIDNEHDGNCPKCGRRTMLISAPSDWRVDDEPYQVGQAKDEEMPEFVQVYDEVTAHFCLTCERITSLSFNARI